MIQCGSLIHKFRMKTTIWKKNQSSSCRLDESQLFKTNQSIQVRLSLLTLEFLSESIVLEQLGMIPKAG